jgi:hypothetical protein
MFLQFEHRLSDSPYVERVWRSHSSSGGSFYSMAEPNLELVVARVGGSAQVILRGPVTRASIVDCPAGGEWLGVRFRLGTQLARLPTAALLDHQSLVLPSSADGRFWFDRRWWEAPAYHNAEACVAALATTGIIRRDRLVETVLDGGRVNASLRSVQRRFLQSIGLTREAFRQMERARHAAHLLQNGVGILDVVDQAGYFDQPHLNRARGNLPQPHQERAQVCDRSGGRGAGRSRSEDQRRGGGRPTGRGRRLEQHGHAPRPDRGRRRPRCRGAGLAQAGVREGISEMSAPRRWMSWAGWGASGLMIAFMLLDSLSKLMLERHVVEATTRIGYPLDVIRPLGAIALACTMLYAIPRTAILGAILLTGYLGGAVASKVRIEDPLFSSVLFGVYFGLLVWGGLYLRNEQLRLLIPLRRGQ